MFGRSVKVNTDEDKQTHSHILLALLKTDDLPESDK